MKITEHIANAKDTLISFEVLPPLKGKTIHSLYEHLDPLMEFRPPWINVTYHRSETMFKKKTDGTFENISKREKLQITRQREKLEKNLGSIADLTRLPSALFIVDVMKEHIAVKEAIRLGIPVFAIVDTNSNPNNIDFVIPANDDATKSVDVILTAMVAAIQEGLEERKVEKVDTEASEIPVAKDKKSRITKRPRTQKEDEEALNLNVAKKFIIEEK
jgi:small subunit ribosomal protein S2